MNLGLERATTSMASEQTSHKGISQTGLSMPMRAPILG